MRTRRTRIGLAAAVAAVLLAVYGRPRRSAAGRQRRCGARPCPRDTSRTPTAVTCVSAAACVGVDSTGTRSRRTTPISGGWTTVDADVGRTRLNAISCAPGGPCVAVGNVGAR